MFVKLSFEGSIFSSINPKAVMEIVFEPLELKEKLDDIYDAHYYIIGTGEFIKTMKTLLEENNIRAWQYFVRAQFVLHMFLRVVRVCHGI